MNVVRLLALDLDDTLLRSDLSISHWSRNIIKKAEASGIAMVLASGRVPAAMEQFAKLLGMHRRKGYLICNNGTTILESDTGIVVSETKIDPKMAVIAFNLADAEGFPVQIYENDVMYVSRNNEFTSYDEKLTGLRQVVVEDFRSMVSEGCNKLLIPGDPALLASLESLLRTYLGDNITLFTSKPYFLEVLPTSTDKGTALAKVASLLGVAQEEVAAIGDSMNDEAMIRWAGLGVAMANADSRIKEIANAITRNTNEEDGVADFIEQYLLTK